MVFHRLRVISFSKSLLSPKVSNRKKTDVKVHNKVEVLTHKKAHNKKDEKDNRTVCIQKMPAAPMPIPRLQYSSKSETFRIPSKSKS